MAFARAGRQGRAGPGRRTAARPTAKELAQTARARPATARGVGQGPHGRARWTTRRTSRCRIGPVWSRCAHPRSARAGAGRARCRSRTICGPTAHRLACAPTAARAARRARAAGPCPMWTVCSPRSTTPRSGRISPSPARLRSRRDGRDTSPKRMRCTSGRARPSCNGSSGTGEIIGTHVLLRDRRGQPLRSRIGHTMLGRPRWRTGINTESKLLLMARAFDALGASGSSGTPTSATSAPSGPSPGSAPSGRACCDRTGSAPTAPGGTRSASRCSPASGPRRGSG